jgi:hypothetical protein
MFLYHAEFIAFWMSSMWSEASFKTGTDYIIFMVPNIIVLNQGLPWF